MSEMTPSEWSDKYFNRMLCNAAKAMAIIARQDGNEPLVVAANNLAAMIEAKLEQKPALCDCERGHNGCGMGGRVCDCQPPTSTT